MKTAIKERSILDSQLRSLYRACCEVARTEYRRLPSWIDGVSPLIGLCVEVSLMVQGMYGGDIVQGKVNGCDHFWNRLPDGIEVDLTSCQFDGDGLRPVGRGRRIVIADDSFDRVRAMLFARHVQDVIKARSKQ